MKFNRGKIIKTKTIVIISGKSKSSNNGRAVTKINICKIAPSNLLSISLFYSLIIRFAKAITPQKNKHIIGNKFIG